MIRVLVADDSITVQRVLSRIIDGQDGMSVVGVASTGREAVRLAQQLSPDVITMDVHMPDMDGFEATAEIMADNPTPIVVVSSSIDTRSDAVAMKALGEGALAAVRKPRLDDDEGIAELVKTVRAMAGVLPLRKRRRSTGHVATSAGAPRVPGTAPQGSATVELVVVGASTGGPQALLQLLGALPALEVPMVVVQHITPGFTPSLVDWFGKSIPLPVCIARQGERLRPGTVYFAPEEAQSRVVEIAGSLRLHETDAPAHNGFRPSADVLFQSVAATLPRRAMGVIMTGMGADGAEGLLQMRRAGCRTLAQDRESCVVYGMPAVAERLGAVEQFADPVRIAEEIGRITGGAPPR